LQASLFCAAQFMTSYGWGVFSDRYGRKFVLLMSIASSALSSIVFGMAGNFWTAALARLLGGLLNATGGYITICTTIPSMAGVLLDVI
jgi:MFS family permease